MGANNTCTVTMDQDKTINVQFRGKRTLTVAKTGPGQGTVVGSQGGLDAPAIFDDTGRVQVLRLFGR